MPVEIELFSALNLIWLGLVLRTTQSAGQQSTGLVSNVRLAISHIPAKTCIWISLLLLGQRPTMKLNQLELSYSGKYLFPDQIIWGNACVLHPVLSLLLGVHLFHFCTKEAGVKILTWGVSLVLMRRLVFFGMSSHYRG